MNASRKTWRKPQAVVLGLGSLLFAWSCGGSDIGTGPAEEAVATTISLAPVDLDFSSLADTSRVVPVVVDQFGEVLLEPSITWTSSDETVATVSSDGLVTAVGNGGATVQATVGVALGSVAVTVSQVPASLVIDPDPIVLNGPGDVLQLLGAVLDAGGSVIEGETVTWSSSDEGVATVDAGLLTAIATGSATISVAAGSLSASAPLTVTALPASITASTDSIGFASLGDTVVVTAVVRDENGDEIVGSAIAWLSLDTSVAVVIDGNVVAAGGGSTKVVASAGPVADTLKVDVVQVPASVSVTPDPISLNGPGDTIRATGIVLDAGGSAIPGESITWTSTDPAIATVDGDGLVSGVSVGESTITATSGSLSVDVAVSVTQTPASVTLSADSVLLSALGETATVEAVVRSANGDVVQGASVTWTSSDPAIASVEAGRITAIAFGSATVTASAGSQTAEVVVVIAEPVTGPSFSQVVNEIFVRRGCAANGCHGRGAGELRLTTNAATSYANLVGVTASAEPAFLRVRPSDATNSYLVIKLEGRQNSGSDMPISGSPLSAADLASIKNWINAGAQNN